MRCVTVFFVVYFFLLLASLLDSLGVSTANEFFRLSPAFLAVAPPPLGCVKFTVAYDFALGVAYGFSATYGVFSVALLAFALCDLDDDDGGAGASNAGGAEDEEEEDEGM